MATEAERAIEAILMVAEEPIPAHLLAQILEVAPARVEQLCADLAESYAAEDRGFVLVRVAVVLHGAVAVVRVAVLRAG